MKTTARLIFYAGVLITVEWRGVAGSAGGGRGKGKGAAEQVPPPRPSFPLLTLPSFLNLPYLQPFASPNRLSSAERVRATKTEYVEVTRRQTVHPVCYTAYEAKAPCLPYSQADYPEDDYDGIESEAIHQAHDSFNLNEVRHAIRSTPAAQVSPSRVAGDTRRTGRYLEVKLRREGTIESSRVEGSEFFPTLLNRVPQQQQATEYQTKTVLITKLEKYTDRRVTATLLAVNCLPVDRSIPMCQNYPNPIRESPDRRSDDSEYDTQSGTSKLEIPDLESAPVNNGNGTFGHHSSESSEADSGETLVGED